MNCIAPRIRPRVLWSVAASTRRWTRAASLLALLLACAGCKRNEQSHGSCEGAAGATLVTGALSPSSAYQVDWSEGSRAIAMRLDCGGKLVLSVEMDRIPSTTNGQWKLPSDDPSCSGGATAPADPGVIPPDCVSNSALSWIIPTPKPRPLLASGTVQLSKESGGELLRGDALLRFEDGTRAEIKFFLRHGDVADLSGATSPKINPIPGRIDF